VFEYGAEASYQRVETFAATVGRRPDIVVSFGVWGAPFDARFARTAHAHGAAPLIQLEPVHASLASIVAGRYDRYLRSYASEVRIFRHPVILSFAPEFNGPWYSWGWTRSPPATWRAAWRHVVTLFRKRGASNVTWLWTVNRQFPGSGPLAGYWPGPGYVDWVGIDAYYSNRNDTFATVFNPTIDSVQKVTTKPVLISETAAGQVTGQARAIPGLFAGIIRRHLLGLVWFDMSQHRGLYHQNWRLEGHPAAIAAFRRGLASWKPRT
jgi:mannan endo-1,4-beta-mannosidase